MNALLASSAHWPIWEWDDSQIIWNDPFLCACTKWPQSHLVTQFWVLSPLHSFLRSMYLTGNQRSACPVTVSMWRWTAWTGIQSMKFTWWQRISRASRSLPSSPSGQLQTQLPSQVLFPSSHPKHPHTPATVHQGFHRDQKGSIIWILDFYQVLIQSLPDVGSDMTHLSLPVALEMCTVYMHDAQNYVKWAQTVKCIQLIQKSKPLF